MAIETMTDLVYRLRRCAPGGWPRCVGADLQLKRLLDEAADRIEALEAMERAAAEHHKAHHAHEAELALPRPRPPGTGNEHPLARAIREAMATEKPVKLTPDEAFQVYQEIADLREWNRTAGSREFRNVRNEFR